VWGREVDGKVLTFHLAGINNQNFLMRDEETGSYWQQITGQAIAGPLRGRALPFVHSDELSFRVWSAEQPQGQVLAPVAKYASDYEEKDWDVKMDKARSILQFPNSGLPMREQVFGIFNQSASRAFPVKRVLADKLVLDHVGAEAVVLVVGPDNLSVRAFRNTTPPRDFYAFPGFFQDTQTGTKWNFQGCPLSGGACLEPVAMVKDYWFDWKNYHPATTIYARHALPEPTRTPVH
jgi:hypothetical protein